MAPLTLRPEVEQFAQVMEAKLRQNDHKGGWQGMTQQEVLRRLYDEAHEVWKELGRPEPDANAVMWESADVANFAMMLWDVTRRPLLTNLDAKPGPGLEHVKGQQAGKGPISPGKRGGSSTTSTTVVEGGERHG